VGGGGGDEIGVVNEIKQTGQKEKRKKCWTVSRMKEGNFLNGRGAREQIWKRSKVFQKTDRSIQLIVKQRWAKSPRTVESGETSSITKKRKKKRDCLSIWDLPGKGEEAREENALRSVRLIGIKGKKTIHSERRGGWAKECT